MPKNKFIVIKRDDVDKYLSGENETNLFKALKEIEDGRTKDGKGCNFYAVINTDEPYFEEIKNIMQKHGHWEE